MLYTVSGAADDFGVHWSLWPCWYVTQMMLNCRHYHTHYGLGSLPAPGHSWFQKRQLDDDLQQLFQDHFDDLRG